MTNKRPKMVLAKVFTKEKDDYRSELWRNPSGKLEPEPVEEEIPAVQKPKKKKPKKKVVQEEEQKVEEKLEQEEGKMEE